MRSGQEFVYPKRRALELAKLVDLPVLSDAHGTAEKIILPIKSADDPVVATLRGRCLSRL